MTHKERSVMQTLAAKTSVSCVGWREGGAAPSSLGHAQGLVHALARKVRAMEQAQQEEGEHRGAV